MVRESQGLFFYFSKESWKVREHSLKVFCSSIQITHSILYHVLAVFHICLFSLFFILYNYLLHGITLCRISYGKVWLLCVLEHWKVLQRSRALYSHLHFTFFLVHFLCCLHEWCFQQVYFFGIFFIRILQEWNMFQSFSCHLISICL